MKKAILISLVAMSLIATEGLAWGQKGHDVTCAIAEKHLTKRAKRHIKKVLDGKSIVYWGNWLDNASHTPQYEYTKSWHYKNINADQTYDEVPPFKDGDVVVAINEQISKLKSGELSHEEEALALKMLIHFLGDIHQPMHLGHQTDLGGNRVNVLFFKEETNLHTVWDTDLVESAHKWGYPEWVDQIDRLNRKERKAIEQGTADDWARETYRYAQAVYENTPEGTKISYDYVAKYTPLVEQQLLKGGIRLARILNEIY
ncbi:MAG: S1/P1 nuclease [Bacteroidaceae bacterium]|nr:S1/P1 nuclease [Bacteroidaceae bacterium]